MTKSIIIVCPKHEYEYKKFQIGALSIYAPIKTAFMLKKKIKFIKK